MQYSQLPQLKHHCNGTSLLDIEAAESEASTLPLRKVRDVTDHLCTMMSGGKREHVCI